MLQLGLCPWKGHRKQVNLQARELTITELFVLERKDLCTCLNSSCPHRMQLCMGN